MADKEERILITTRHKNEKLNMTFTDMYKEYTIQEAIERMAKAAKKAYRGYFYIEPHHPNISDIMEAALNSLLESNDDER